MRTHPPSTPAPFSDHTPAQAGRLTVAYLIDSTAVLIAASLLYLVWPSALLAILTIVELCLVMVFTRATTGHSLGSLITRTPALRQDVPTAPGLKAECRHALILGALHLTIIGPLLVHALARNGQSLPDRLAGIIVIQPTSDSVQGGQTIGRDAYGRQTLAHSAPAVWATTPQVPSSPATPQAPSSPATPPVLSSPQAQAPLPTMPSPQAAPSPHVAPPAPATPFPAPTAAQPQKHTDPAIPSPTEKASTTRPSPTQQYEVVFDSGERQRITTSLLIGRSPTARSAGEDVLSIPDPTRSLSRTHVRIVRSRTGLLIDDLGSANGTQIQYPSGTTIEVTPGSPEKVTVGCTIHLGERSFHITSENQ